jgi:dTDP-4-dehydrorhamnose reductase
MKHPALPDSGARALQPIVLVGYEGMLGWAWHSLLESSPYQWSVAGLPETDLTERSAVVKLFERRPRCIINCAAWTDVDGAESNEQAAFDVNANAMGTLAELCRQHDVLLVNYSTDYVFDGRATTPYGIDHPRAPIGAYARSKAAGEEAIERSGCRFLNIRTSWLYAPWGKNFVRTIAKLLRDKPTIKVVNDQRGRPTSAEHLARGTLDLIGRGSTGNWHLTDGGECTWFDFAGEIKGLTDARCEVQPCTSSEYPRPAKRPAYSVLDISRTEEMIGAMPDWRTNLADVVGRLEA